MKITVEIEQRNYQVDSDHPLDISIPVQFSGPQPNVYNVPAASARAYEDGRFIGDTRRGGSCNFEEYHLIPHCNGTHTECVGHLSFERISIQKTFTNCFLPATLISVVPNASATTNETTVPEPAAGDLLLTRKALQAHVQAGNAFNQAIVIRTLPNTREKMARRYGDPPPPYFTTEAMAFLLDAGVQHLLVDVPSVDRTMDEGKMTTHHMFWNLPPGSHDVDPENASQNTITEMIFVPDEVPDGKYFLNLQIPAFAADAAPSRPMLFELLQP